MKIALRGREYPYVEARNRMYFGWFSNLHVTIELAIGEQHVDFNRWGTAVQVGNKHYNRRDE